MPTNTEAMTNGVVALVGPDDRISAVSGPDWAVAGPRMRAIAAATPSPLHLQVRALRNAGRIEAIISDTDDVLLDEAGVTPDVELCGSARESVCPSCAYTEPLLCLLELLPVPRCAACGAVLIPGTPPSPGSQAAAEALVRGADVLVLANATDEHPLARLARRTRSLSPA